VVKQVVVSNETHTHSMQHSSVVLSRSVLLRRLGPSFSPEAGATFFCRLKESALNEEMCAKSGISSREGESSVRSSARAQFAKRRSCATTILICLSVGVR